MPHRLVSRALLVTANPLGPSGSLHGPHRAAHPVPYLTICATLSTPAVSFHGRPKLVPNLRVSGIQLPFCGRPYRVPDNTWIVELIHVKTIPSMLSKRKGRGPSESSQSSDRRLSTNVVDAALPPGNAGVCGGRFVGRKHRSQNLRWWRASHS